MQSTSPRLPLHPPQTPPPAPSKASLRDASRSLRRTILTTLLVCTFYITVSASIVFANKALTHVHTFRATNFLLLLQMLFTILTLHLLRDLLNLISFPPFDPAQARHVMPVSLFYSLNAAVALVALRELSVPSYTLVKRLAPLATLALEAVLLRRHPTPTVISGLLVMAAGTVVAARADVDSTPAAWALGVASCLFQALYLTFMKRSASVTGMSALGVLYYHSILSLPFLSILAVVTGDFTGAMAYGKWREPEFLTLLFVSLALGLLLNYALFLCTEKTSPTSTLVSGHVKALFQTVVGLFAFGGVSLNARYLFGTVLNATGGAVYIYGKLIKMRDDARKEAQDNVKGGGEVKI